VGDRLALGVVWRWRAALARRRGDFAVAERCVERALSFATEPTLERAEILLELGDQHAQQQRVAQAEAAYLRSRDLSASLAAAAQLRAAELRLEALHRSTP
jgi:hypothetical protein